VELLNSNGNTKQNQTVLMILCQTYDAGEFKEYNSNIDIYPEQYRGFI